MNDISLNCKIRLNKISRIRIISINGAIINLDALTEKYGSDYYIDFCDDGYDIGDLLYEDVNVQGSEGDFDDFTHCKMQM